MAVDTAVGTERRRGGTYRRALRHRDYRWLATGFAVSAIGSWAYNVALAVIIWERTGSAAWVGAATLSRFIPVLLLSSYGGIVAERFERTRVMRGADLTATFWMSLLTIVAFVEGPIVLAIVLASLTSLTMTVYVPAEAAMTPQVVGEEDLAAANAVNSAIENGSVIIGPAIGAIILWIGPPWVAFGVNALTFLFSAWCVRQVSVRSRPSDVTEGGEVGVFAQIAVGFRAIGSSLTAAVLVGGSVAASFFYGTDTVLYVVLSEEKLGTGASGYGYLLTALGVGGLIATVIIDRLASSAKLGRIISIGMIVYCLPTALMVVVTDPAAAFGIQVVRGAGTLVVDVLAVTALQRTLAPDLIARVFGVFMSLVIGAIALGAFVTPILLSAVGLDTTLLIFGLGTPITVVILYPVITKIDRIATARLAELAPRIAALEGLGIFAAASRTALERLAGSIQEVLATPGTDIVREGEPADCLYVITSGEVEVVAKQHREEARRMATLGTGDYFGEIGLLEGIPRTATVRATEPSILYRIDGDTFLESLSQARASTGLLDGASCRLQLTAPSYIPTSEFLARPDDEEPAPTADV